MKGNVNEWTFLGILIIFRQGRRV